jgi:ribulose bisphosphate carboxylase small subunit
MHRNIAPETKPWLIICTIAPCTPSSLKMKKPSVTKPMCAIDVGHQLLHVLLHQGHQADVQHRDQAQRDDHQAYSREASGAIGIEKRRKP